MARNHMINMPGRAQFLAVVEKVIRDEAATLSEIASEVRIARTTLTRIRDGVGAYGPATHSKCRAWVRKRRDKEPVKQDQWWSGGTGAAFLKLAKDSTHRALAKSLGVSRSTVAGWIKGKTPNRASKELIAGHVRDFIDAGALDEHDSVNERKTPKSKFEIPEDYSGVKPMKDLGDSGKIQFASRAKTPVQFKEAKNRFKFFERVSSGAHATFVVGLVRQGKHPNSARQDPEVIGTVRDIHGKWCARWECPYQMTTKTLTVSGYKTREQAAEALLTVKRALGVQ